MKRYDCFSHKTAKKMITKSVILEGSRRPRNLQRVCKTYVISNYNNREREFMCVQEVKRVGSLAATIKPNLSSAQEAFTITNINK